MATILIVDDDACVRSAFRRALEGAGFAVLEGAEGDEALQLARRHSPALVLLDVDMPARDGWSTLEALRGSGYAQPILMITHVGDVASKVRGLDGGADDYLPKPCTAVELLARVRALLRRAAPPPARPRRWRLGPVVLDLDRKLAVVGPRTVRLTRTEFALLELLASRPGVPVPREEIFARVWGGKEGNSHTLDTHIWRLRQKLGDNTDEPQYLLNHPGVGFSLSARFVDAAP